MASHFLGSHHLNACVMEFLPVILTFVMAYGVFLAVAYFLARLFFPTLEIENEAKPKRTKRRSFRRIVSH